MDMSLHEHQAALQASLDAEAERGALTRLEEAWVASVGSLDDEMLEYHRSRHRDGGWRNAYGIPG